MTSSAAASAARRGKLMCCLDGRETRFGSMNLTIIGFAMTKRRRGFAAISATTRSKPGYANLRKHGGGAVPVMPSARQADCQSAIQPTASRRYTWEALKDEP